MKTNGVNCQIALLRAGLAEAAARKAAADGERQRDELASNQRGRADEHADECARVGTGNQSRRGTRPSRVRSAAL